MEVLKSQTSELIHIITACMHCLLPISFIVFDNFNTNLIFEIFFFDPFLYTAANW